MINSLKFFEKSLASLLMTIGQRMSSPQSLRKEKDKTFVGLSGTSIFLLIFPFFYHAHGLSNEACRG
jgi:hypothetical protein